MATSKILYMKDCGRAFHGKHLKVALEYISDSTKTQDGRLIAGVNCIPEYAYEQMKETKKRFGKIDKRQAYHLIISFKEGELDADTAFEITEKFVKEYLGDKYEAVYAVHDNTEHIHSHIVFNSVSFVDGKKYRYEKGDWAKYIQPVTNKLCEEYGISTIEIENDSAKSNTNYKEWNEYKNGPFIWADMIKRDLDVCIVQADSYEQFLSLLAQKGYEIKTGKYLAIKPPGMPRYKRVKLLGEDYSEEQIQNRIPRENLSTYKAETFEEAEKIVYAKIPRGKRAKLSGLQKKYYARLYRVGLIERRPYSQAWKFKDEIRQMHKLQEQYLFLVNHDIETIGQLTESVEQLADYKKSISSEKSKVYRARKKCEGLFEVKDAMDEYLVEENAYQSGDNFFEMEHMKWITLEKQLSEQGYSYDEVSELKEHFRKEINRVRTMEKQASKEMRIAKSILQELAEEVKTPEQVKEIIESREQQLR